MAEEALLPYHKVAAAQRKTLVCEVAAGLTLHGDVSMIQRLIALLMDNAMKYSPEGDTIRVTVKKCRKK